MNEKSEPITPKEKINLGKQINGKKKRFFRLLLGNYDNWTFCSEAETDLVQCLRSKIEELIKSKISTTRMVGDGEQNSKKTSKRKVIKFSELIFGLNEAIKKIELKEIVMIWIDKSLAINLINVIKKLCETNRIYCLQLDLNDRFREIFNLSSLAVIAFKSSIKLEDSIFNDLYRSILPIFDCDEIIEKLCEKESLKRQLNDDKIETESRREENFTDNNNNNNFFHLLSFINQSYPSYRIEMQTRFKDLELDPKSKENAFNNNQSFIRLCTNSSIDSFDFIDYRKSIPSPIVSIELSNLDEKNSDSSSVKKGNIDSFVKKVISKKENEKSTKIFQSPKLIQGQSFVEKKGRKKEKRNVRLKNQFICKKTKMMQTMKSG